MKKIVLMASLFNIIIVVNWGTKYATKEYRSIPPTNYYGKIITGNGKEIPAENITFNQQFHSLELKCEKPNKQVKLSDIFSLKIEKPIPSDRGNSTLGAIITDNNKNQQHCFINNDTVVYYNNSVNKEGHPSQRKEVPLSNIQSIFFTGSRINPQQYHIPQEDSSQSQGVDVQHDSNGTKTVTSGNTTITKYPDGTKTIETPFNPNAGWFRNKP